MDVRGVMLQPLYRSNFILWGVAMYKKRSQLQNPEFPQSRQNSPKQGRFGQSDDPSSRWGDFVIVGPYNYSECDEDLGLSRRRPGDSEEIGKR